jgi:hypothetical protein
VTTILIDMGDGTTAPMTPPGDLGDAFAAIIAEALSWDEAHRTAMNARYTAATAAVGFVDAVGRIFTVLSRAGLFWSGEFGEDNMPPEAGPYIDTLCRKWSVGAAEVAAAVLARDLRLVTEADFTTITGWWTAAGLKLPDPGYSAMRLQGIHDDTIVYAADPAEADRHAKHLVDDRYRIPGWPLTSACTYDTTAADGRFFGMPGMVWYRERRQVFGADLVVGDWLDTDDHHGARAIADIPSSQPPASACTRIVMIGGGEPVTVSTNLEYRVVDPDTLVDMDAERPYEFTGGPWDGQVQFRPRAGETVLNCLVDGDRPEWVTGDSRPGIDQYVPDHILGDTVQMHWRTPTPADIEYARTSNN